MKIHKYFNFKNLILYLTIVFLLIGGCGSREPRQVFTANEIYDLFGLSRHELHRELGLKDSDISHPLSEEEDPLRQLEQLTSPRQIETRECLVQFHYSSQDKLDEFQCFLDIPKEKSEETWKWLSDISDQLDKKWKDPHTHLGDSFQADTPPDFAQPFTKSRQWSASDGIFYTYTVTVVSPDPRQYNIGVIFSRLDQNS